MRLERGTGHQTPAHDDTSQSSSNHLCLRLSVVAVLRARAQIKALIIAAFRVTSLAGMVAVANSSQNSCRRVGPGTDVEHANGSSQPGPSTNENEMAPENVTPAALKCLEILMLSDVPTRGSRLWLREAGIRNHARRAPAGARCVPRDVARPAKRASSGSERKVWLGGRDSNPDTVIQRRPKKRR